MLHIKTDNTDYNTTWDATVYIKKVNGDAGDIRVVMGSKAPSMGHVIKIDYEDTIWSVDNEGDNWIAEHVVTPWLYENGYIKPSDDDLDVTLWQWTGKKVD